MSVLWCFADAAFREMLFSSEGLCSTRFLASLTASSCCWSSSVQYGLIILSGSPGNGLFGSLQDCLVEGLDFGIQVLPFIVDPLRKLVS